MCTTARSTRSPSPASTVYVGGSFSGATAVSNPPVAKNRVAAFEASNSGNGLGNLRTLWDPNADSDVYALDVVGSTLYVGGLLHPPEEHRRQEPSRGSPRRHVGRLRQPAAVEPERERHRVHARARGLARVRRRPLHRGQRRHAARRRRGVRPEHRDGHVLEPAGASRRDHGRHRLLARAVGPVHVPQRHLPQRRRTVDGSRVDLHRAVLLQPGRRRRLARDGGAQHVVAARRRRPDLVDRDVAAGPRHGRPVHDARLPAAGNAAGERGRAGRDLPRRLRARARAAGVAHERDRDPRRRLGDGDLRQLRRSRAARRSTRTP